MGLADSCQFTAAYGVMRLARNLPFLAKPLPTSQIDAYDLSKMRGNADLEARPATVVGGDRARSCAVRRHSLRSPVHG